LRLNSALGAKISANRAGNWRFFALALFGMGL
jgi:hypothetical protein